MLLNHILVNLVGDLHGDLDKARCALEIAGVLSSDGRDLWIGGETVSHPPAYTYP